MTVIKSLIIGGIGGFLNCILFYEGFITPRMDRTEQGHPFFNPGFLGNIILGASAGFIVFAFIAQELSEIKQMSLILLSGIGGGNVLLTFLQKNQIQFERRRRRLQRRILNMLT